MQKSNGSKVDGQKKAPGLADEPGAFFAAFPVLIYYLNTLDSLYVFLLLSQKTYDKDIKDTSDDNESFYRKSTVSKKK